MKRFAAVLVLAGLAGTAVGGMYSNNFDAEAPGTLPAGWYLATPWGDWAPGPITAAVAAAPGGGNALKVVWGTDWASYDASSGETGYNIDLTGIDPEAASYQISYDFYTTNDAVWMMFGQQWGFPPAGAVHMNDDPAKPGHMDVGDQPSALTDVPLSAWVSVTQLFDSATNAWTTTISYTSGSGGGVFNGLSTDPIANQYWFGGWAFKSTMDNSGGVYANELFIDNFSVNVVPEPAAALLLLAGLALRRR